MRDYKANSAVVIIGRLMYQMRQEERARERAKHKRSNYKRTRRDHARVSLNRW